MNKEINKLIEDAPFVPLFCRILLKIDETKEKTDAGIVLPEEYRRRAVKQIETGTILAIGDQCFYESASKGKSGSEIVGLKVGDRITFAKHSGEYSVSKGISYRLINDTDVTGIVKPGAEI